jgi:hypothetical protein
VTGGRAGGRRGRALRSALLAVLVACGAGCQLDVQVEVDVDRDGSGAVTVAAALDEAAAARVPELADQLEVGDLEADGWTVTGPALEADGLTWVRATKPFADPEGAAPVLDAIGGPTGPFRDLRIARRPTLLHDVWRLTGTVDLTAGLAAFSDDALRARLDGTDVGWTEEEVVAAAGAPLEEVFTFRVEADLPGRVEGNGEAAPAGTAAWQLRLGERQVLDAAGRRLHTATVAWFAVAGVAVVAGLAGVVGARRRGGRARYRSAREDHRR